ncbi:MAG: HNH endonuclease, partial [Acidimicrobiia bacterium]|nr:HNH endonuclease [Acidimicrobiia bacterium]
PQPQATPAEPPAPQPQAASDQPPAPQPEATPNEPPAPEQAPNEPPPPEAATQLVERLRPLVADQDPNVPDYDRDHFAGWLDDDGDCVNTRHEVLQSEAVDFSMNAEGCAVAAGEWFDPYTDRTYTNPRDLDVDHVVALADAWVSGAWAWADELLDRFSNDFGNLNAIAAGENRSKSARGPADYSPTAPGARCEYLVQYATVKIRWQLSITPQDFEVVATGLSGCEVDIVPDPPAMAPVAPSPPAPPTTVSTQPATDCHPAYRPCLPNLPGDALNCGDLRSDQKPVTVIVPGEDPYRLDRDRDGRGCTS